MNLKEVKKFIVVAISILLLLPSSLQSRNFGEETKLPSKEDIIGFLNAIQQKSKNFFSGKGNIAEDLVLFSNDMKNASLVDALEKFYEINGINYDVSSIQSFLNESNMPEDVQNSIALLLYTYVNASMNPNKVEAAFLIAYAIKETGYYLNKFMLNETIFGPYGKIAFGGKHDDIYSNYSFVIDFDGNDEYQKCLFIVDLKGNDKYIEMVAINDTYITIDENGNDAYTNACYSINGSYYLFDLNGNDTYAQKICSSYEDGYAFLLDFDGNDVYRGMNETQAFSRDSISILIDFNGDDCYYGNDYCQASSVGGDAVLIDFTGSDTFIAASRSQAYATGGGIQAVKGFAILINFAGSDMYVAANYSQGYASSFGFALLLDFLGDDSYSSRTFSQASSTAMGAAAFIDSDGLNKFKHGSFCQGYMLGGLSLFMNNFEMNGNEKLLEMINKLDFNFGNLFG